MSDSSQNTSQSSAPFSAGSAAEQGLACCHACAQLTPVSQQHCSRCNEHIHLRIPDSIQKTMAFTIAAIIFYLPANFLPIMNTAQFGNTEPSTIIGGVIYLWGVGSYPVASVIFLASVIIPSSKMLALLYLCWSVKMGPGTDPKKHTVVYRIVELIGRWSMVDVFVVSILVALVQLGGLITILPGLGALFFCGVVVLTIFAAENFDSRLIWDKSHNRSLPQLSENKDNEFSYE